MTVDARKQDAPAPDATRLLSLPDLKLSIRARILIGALACVVVAAVAYAAVTFYPNTAPPPPSEVERQAAAMFGYPVDGADDKIVGDLLVERFYAVDAETGEHYVADFLKGRIQGIQSQGQENAGPYLLLLDLRNLQRDRALYAAYVDTVARPQGNYLGLSTFSGGSDAFRLNYEGFLPDHRETIAGPNGQDPYEYLLTQKYDDVSQAQRLVKHDGYDYVLNNTDRFPFFRSEFRTGKAMLLSELIIIDTTAPAQRAKFLQLRSQYPTPAVATQPPSTPILSTPPPATPAVPTPAQRR